MELEDHEIERFTLAWETDFGETLCENDARAELSRLLTFLYALHDSAHSSEPQSGNDLQECGSMAP